MTIDLTNEQHREALRWACEQQLGDLKDDHVARVIAHTLETYGDRGKNDPPAAALRALLDPSQSAAIVRALLEGCGVDVARIDPRPMTCGRGDSVVHVVGWGADDERWCGVGMPDVPALILRLLDAKDRDSALAALREAGR